MQLRLRYHLVDVFADRRFCGNPLAVVEGADRLSADDMLRIAREFNLSETAFLQEPADPINSARARIFTPSRELPFAGHPTIGAAAVLATTRAADALARHGVVIVLEEAAGLFRCDVGRKRDGAAVYGEFALPAPPQKAGEPPAREAVARALSLDAGDIGFGRHAPSVWSAGTPFVFAPLRSREALERARRDPGAFAAVAGTAAGVYLYTQDTLDKEAAIGARMLANGLGFDEDPATGAAAAAFAGVAHEYENPGDGEHQIFIEQGRLLGRPSRLTLRMEVEGGRLAKVRVGGQVVQVAEGVLTI